MNNTTIFTHDSSIPGDIIDLQTLISHEIDVLNKIYEHIIYKNEVPPNLKDYDIVNLMLHDVSLLAQDSAVILFSSFFVIMQNINSYPTATRTHVVQFDVKTSEIYVYNLSEDDATARYTFDIISMVDTTIDFAEGANCYQALICHTSIQTFLKCMLSGFSAFKDISDDNIDAICTHMGYNPFDKRILN